MHARLVAKHELVALQGAAQVCFELEPLVKN
jgi:hypothetical protein